MRDTGMGRGDEYRQRAINSLVDKLDKEEDTEKLAAEISRIENGRRNWLTGASEVRLAEERAKQRLETMQP